MTNIHYIRASSTATQREVSDAIGISVRELRRIEYGECFPSYKTTKALENYFNKPIDELLAPAKEEMT